MTSRQRNFVPRIRRRFRATDDVDIDDKEHQRKIQDELRARYEWKTGSLLSDDLGSKFSLEQEQSGENQFDVELGQAELSSIDLFDAAKVPTRFVDDQTGTEHICIFSLDDELKKNIELDSQAESCPELRFSIDEDNGIRLSSADENVEPMSLDWAIDDERRSSNIFPLHDAREEEPVRFDVDGQTRSNQFVEFQQENESVRLDVDASSNERDQTVDCVEFEFHEERFDLEREADQFVISIEEKIFLFALDKLSSSRLDSVLFELNFVSEGSTCSFDLVDSSFDQRNIVQLCLDDQLSTIFSLEQDSIELRFQLDESNFDTMLRLDLDRETAFRLDRSNSFIDDQTSRFDIELERSTKTELDFELKQIFRVDLDDDRIRSKPMRHDRLSLDEVLFVFYSLARIEQPVDLFNKIFVIDEKFPSSKVFRRFRCQHMSIRSDENKRLDLQTTNQFDLFPSGEFHEMRDFDDFSLVRGSIRLKREREFSQFLFSSHSELIDCYRNLDETFVPSFDVNEHHRIETRPSPFCLIRSDFERVHPPTANSYRREIGSISFDNSLEQPTYRFDKSFKKYFHPPPSSDQLTFDAYAGYSEFVEEIRRRPTDFYRQYDATDLRHLLTWLLHHQHLFSSNKRDSIRPPRFVCRRKVLEKILSNLYCDSEPWKIFVVRIQGVFYMSLSNRCERAFDQLTKDEYSGISFERRFTSEQPNTTRFREKFPIENSQQQYHSIFHWTFGPLTLVYTCEIDAQLKDTTKRAEQTDAQKEETANNNRTSSNYVEIKCTNKKIFQSHENRLKVVHWWFQNWLANIDQIFIGYKSKEKEGIVDQFDLLTNQDLLRKFLSRYDIRLNGCISYLYSFLEMIERTVLLDDPNTVHVFAYIPQEIEIDDNTGKKVQFDMPDKVEFRYTTMDRSNKRHQSFMPQWFIDEIQRVKEPSDESNDEPRNKKRYSHRARKSCPLKQRLEKNQTRMKKGFMQTTCRPAFSPVQKTKDNC